MSKNDPVSGQRLQPASTSEPKTKSAPSSSGLLWPYITKLQQGIGNRGVGRLLEGIKSRREAKIGSPDEPEEREADAVADQTAHRITTPLLRQRDEDEDELGVQRAQAEFSSRVQGQHDERDAGGSSPLSEDTLAQQIETSRAGGSALPRSEQTKMEDAFGADFSKVRIHTDPEAARLSKNIGARAFTTGPNIFFGENEYHPESSSGKHLLAHELTHTVQQGVSRPLRRSRTGVLNSGSAAVSTGVAARGVQAAPKVTAAAAPAEVGAGGKTVTATATVAGRGRVEWNLVGNPAGVTINKTTGKITATQASAASGGTKFKARAQLTGTPGDDAQSNDILLVGVTKATFAPKPAFAPQPFAGGGPQPFPTPDTADPNRDGYGGNTAVATVDTLPKNRLTTLTLTGGGATPGASVDQNVITPGKNTGVIKVRAKDKATEAFLDAQLNIDPVPVRVKKLIKKATLAPASYGAIHQFQFQSSDATGTPLTRVVGETVTFDRDDFGIIAGFNPPGGPNPAPVAGLSAPANAAQDTVGTPIAAGVGQPVPGVVLGQDPLDVNNYIGPGVTATLPRLTRNRQGFHHLSWTGTQSDEFDQGFQQISMRQVAAKKFKLKTEQVFSGAAAPSTDENYLGPAPIFLTNVTATPQAPKAQAIAADGVATGDVTVNTTVPGRNVNWLVLKGSIAFTVPALGANIAVGAKATVQAGFVPGNIPIQVQDSVFANRQAKGFVKVVPVQLKNIAAAPKNVPAGTLVTNISVNANPGGRVLQPTLDVAATNAGVVAANVPAAGPAAALPLRQVTVTRPAGFTGNVTVTLRDTIRPAAAASIKVKFL
jgi:hypothetical protein